MKKKMVIFTGQGIHGDLEILTTAQMTGPNAAHHKIAALQNDYDVTVLTTCEDDAHEQAGINKVVHIGNEELPEERLNELKRIIRLADVCLFLGCQKTRQPVRSLLISVPSECRMYVCFFNKGENKSPRLKNLTQAFCASCFAHPEESIDIVVNDMERFQVDRRKYEP